MSDVTKKELSKFQYQPRQDADSGQSSPSLAKDDVDAATPLTRLNWRDLVEPGASAENDLNTSPNDKIMWNNKQDSLYLSALSPMMARKRKRARSSSPLSSPSADKPEPPVVYVGMLKEALKLSRADPTLELWDRYSLNGHDSAVSRAGAANPVLEQLMTSSSPKPSKDASTPRTEENLRRAMSCGLVWPKRRKMSKAASQGSSGQMELEAASKSSLVTALLDTATNSLPTESPRHDTSPSPTKRRRHPTNPSPPRRAASGGSAMDMESSDYGDDEFDDDTFMELEATIRVTDSTRSLAPDLARQAQSDTENLPHAEMDEFKDLDDSIFDQANGLVVGSEYPDQKLHAPPAETPAHRPKSDYIRKDPADEFEDDFDGDIDFDAVELAATQSVKQPPRSPSTTKVREDVARPSCYAMY